MNRFKSVLIALSLVLLSGSVYAQAQSTNSDMTVIELFTSQGCSSCPSADRYLGVLAQDESHITLACHVTYWNYLGWKDTFSLPFCDKRQRSYRDSLRKRTSYTPQMVINGKYEGVGSQRRQIQSALTNAKKDRPLSNIALSLKDNQFELNLSSVRARNHIEIFLLGVADKKNLSISRGENSGRTLDYHNPVIAHYSIKMSSDTASTVRQRVALSEQITTWVALAQDTQTGHILAAGRYVNL